MSFPCSDCSQSFKNKAARNHHRWSQHSEIPPIDVSGKRYAVERKGGKLHCPVDRCGRSFTSREAFMRHVKQAHAVGSEPPSMESSSSPPEREALFRSTAQPSLPKDAIRQRSEQGWDDVVPTGQHEVSLRQRQRGGTEGSTDAGFAGESHHETSLTSSSGMEIAGGLLPGFSSQVGLTPTPEDGDRQRVLKVLPGENYLIYDEALNPLRLCMHAQLSILICPRCEAGIGSEAALGHVKNKHGVVASKSEKAAFTAFCQRRNVCERPDRAPIPQAGGPPVKGIAAPVPGYSCRADPSNCRYSVRDFQTLLRHSRTEHGKGLARDADREETMVQAIFQGVGRKFFEVDDGATAESDLDMRDHLRLRFLPSVRGDALLTAGSDRDRPPLLKITMWDEFLVDVRRDGEQRKAAWKMKQGHSPTEDGGLFASLEKVVKEHHSRAKAFWQETPHAFTVAKVLLNGPGFSPEQSKYFRFLSDDNDTYLEFFVQMIRAMVRKERGHEFRMTFVYTETQRENLRSLVRRLIEDATEQSQDSTEEAILAYQEFCWSLVYTPRSKRVGAWDNPIRRFIWLMALRDDGSFMDATNLTPLLAKLKYFCRVVALYEALADKEPVSEMEEDAVDSVAQTYCLALKLGTPTTFNMIWELQQAASTLAYSQVQDPKVFVDPDHAWISIGTEVLYLDRLRSGMERLIQDARAAFVSLSQESAWPVLPESHIVDNLGKTDRGYSFLEEVQFSHRKHEFFFASVQKWKLGSFSGNGRWIWDEVAIREYLDRSDRMWGHVIYALFIGTQLSTRVAQFLQIQLRNADRPRNLIFQGNEAIVLGRYSKTTNLKGVDNCTPAFLADPLRDILLVLLGSGQREAQAILAGLVYGEESRYLYRTYLCVQNGARIVPKAFYNAVKTRNRELFQCAWGASDLRQGMITLGRVFVSPDETFPCSADDLLAEAADHSTEVDLAHYAIVHGAIPRLSNSSLTRHRWLADKWSSLLGMGPDGPPEPVHSRVGMARSEKLPDASELAARVSDMVVDKILIKLADMGLTVKNIRELVTLGEEVPSVGANEGLRAAATPISLDDEMDGFEALSQLSKKRKRTIPPASSAAEKR